MLRGPDVSSYQGFNIDWSAVKDSGRSFAWIKATEGVNYLNPTFRSHWPAMKAAGLVRGAYHFAQPDQNGPIVEAGAFVNAVPLAPGDLLALDLEVGSGNLLHWTTSFLDAVADAVGFMPWLYSGRWFMDPHGVLGSPQLSEAPLWLSGYTQQPPAVPSPWANMGMWQFTDASWIPGINGPVDESYFFGDEQQLRRFGVPTPAQDPAPTRDEQLVTMLSVMGDTTYPDGVDMDSQMPGQPVGITRRIFQRELVQGAKHLLGA